MHCMPTYGLNCSTAPSERLWAPLSPRLHRQLSLQRSPLYVNSQILHRLSVHCKFRHQESCCQAGTLANKSVQRFWHKNYSLNVKCSYCHCYEISPRIHKLRETTLHQFLQLHLKKGGKEEVVATDIFFFKELYVKDLVLFLNSCWLLMIAIF